MAEQNEEKDNKKDQLSPMMQHYIEKKEEYKDCLLFYRLGDFYEMFFNDAILASKELEITLTGRACGQEERAPMCRNTLPCSRKLYSKINRERV